MNKEIRGCLLARPGRGDCLHYIGIPKVFDENTTDVYGRPYGWCEICWSHYQIEKERDINFHLREENAKLRRTNHARQ